MNSFISLSQRPLVIYIIKETISVGNHRDRVYKVDRSKITKLLDELINATVFLFFNFYLKYLFQLGSYYFYHFMYFQQKNYTFE